MLQDDPGSRNPVRFFTVDEVTDDIKRAPGLWTFSLKDPVIGEIAKERV
jgi:hypothetical protein